MLDHPRSQALAIYRENSEQSSSNPIMKKYSGNLEVMYWLSKRDTFVGSKKA
jgi:hypothetical protein